MNIDPYKKLAKFYDTFVEPFNTALRKIVLKMILPKKDMRVLEIGCGTGLNLKLYQEAECEIHGIDLSPSMVNAASRKLGEKADIRVGDASRMPYQDNSFDLVVAMFTLHEMPGSIRLPVINEMARVTKMDGHLLLVDFHPGPVRFPKGWLYKVAIFFIEMCAGREHFKNYRNFIANKGLPPLIETNNLHIEKKKIVGYGNLALFSLSLAK
jgi:ubiquinone/menaquinone biosynthesis C-methylase UbiE